MATTKLTALRTSAGNNFARAYKYKFNIKANKGSLLTISGVTTDPSNLIEHSCLNAAVPSSGTQMIEVEVGRHTMREPGRNDTPGTFSPEFVLSGDYLIYKFFRGWKDKVSPSMFTKSQAELSVDYHATITIIGYDSENKAQTRHTLHNCWCRNAPEIPHADESNDVIRWSPEIAYEFIEFENGDASILDLD